MIAACRRHHARGGEHAVAFGRRGGDDEGSGAWATLDDDDLTSLSRTSQTETMPAPGADDTFVVEEQLAATSGNIGDTIEVPRQVGATDFDFTGDDDVWVFVGGETPRAIEHVGFAARGPIDHAALSDCVEKVVKVFNYQDD